MTGSALGLPINFSAYIAERTRDFTGREWVFAELDRWLVTADVPQYFIITGAPGIGKTAVAARLTQVRELAAYHLHGSAGRDPRPADFRMLDFSTTRLHGRVCMLLAG
jgi:hypothetical protein